MKSLQQIWEDLPEKSDKGDVHSYLPVYEELLAPYRLTAINVLEIGLFAGASLRMWEIYFNDNLRSTHCNVHGIDCDEQPHGGMADLRPMIAEGLHHIHILNAEDAEQVESEFGGMKFQIIIEDAGHHLSQQLSLYSIFKHYLAEGGIYCLEDVQDLDKDREVFLAMDDTKDIEIVDLRKSKVRYDDCLVIIKDKP